jgi:hypothetical protein
MKRFKVEGWFRFQDQKDFETTQCISDQTEEQIINWFKEKYSKINFYKITVEEI